MTGAYATFANGGSGVIPHVIARIRTENGRVLYERSPVPAWGRSSIPPMWR